MAELELLGVSDPDAEALIHYSTRGVTRWSRAELWAAVAAATSEIERRSPPSGLVLIMGSNSPATMVQFIATIAAGRIASIFPPPHPIQDASYYRKQQEAAIGSIGPDLIITIDPGTANTVRELAPMFADRVFEARFPLAPGDWRAAAQRVCDRLFGQGAAGPLFLQHSSGTTGIKKACAIEASLLLAQYNTYWRGTVRRLTPTPRVATWLPLYHDMGLIAAFLLPLLDNAPIISSDTFDWVAKPQILLDIIAAEQTTITWMPNFAFRYLVRLKPSLKERDLSSMVVFVNCSEPCRADDAVAFETTFAPWGVRRGSVVGCYAMAETVFAITQAEPGRQRVLSVPASVVPGAPLPSSRDADAPADEAAVKRVASSGPPIPGVEIVTYDQGSPLSEGCYGELAVRSPFNFGGYSGMSAAESNLRPDGFYMTGDLGAVINGEVFVFGRTKEIVIVNGKNLHAGDLEQLVSQVAGVKPGRVVAFGLENPRTGSEDLIIVAERDPIVGFAAKAISTDITAAVTSIFLVKPFDVRVVADRWLVKSTSGKVSRLENREKYLSTFRAAPGATS